MAEHEGRSWGLGVAGAGLAALSFWFGGVARRPAEMAPAAPVRQTAPAAPRATSHAADVGARLVAEFLGEPARAARDTALDFDALVVTLPDPYDSHLDYSYDAQLEAVQLAFGDAGWLLDRFWVPRREDSVWVVTPGEGGGADSARVAAHERHPGAILFRRVGRDSAGGVVREGRPALRLVYLIPEMPTGGVHKDALRAALAERERLRAALRPPAAADTIRIVGPSFSGAAYSIVRVLRDWLAAPGRGATRASLVSGTATSLSLPLVESARGGRIGFSTTIAPDYLLDAVLRCDVLPRLGLQPRQVLLLVESSTEYGQTLEETVGAPCGRRGRAEPFRVVRFPLAIASLRAEYARHPEATDTEQRPMPGVPAAPRIPVPLIGAGEAAERPPLRSPLTPAALDLELESIVRLLRDTQVRAVGLLASDVRDKLFLGDELRKRLRDVQLFTFESELLYARRDYGEALRGMLVFSTYPLLPAARLWEGDPRGGGGGATARSDAALGIYNATLAALGERGTMREYGTPARVGARASMRPPVWLTVVGNGAIAPLTVFPDSTAWPRTLRLPSARPPAPWPVLPVGVFAWLVMLGAAAVTLALAGAALSRAVTPPSPDGRHGREAPPRSAFAVGPPPLEGWDTRPDRAEQRVRWDDAAAFEAVRGDSLRIHRWLYRALLLVSMLAVFVPALTLVRRAHDVGHPVATSGPDWFAHAGTAVLTAAAALGALAALVCLVVAVVLLARTSERGLAFVRRTRPTWPGARRVGWGAEIVLRGAVVALGLWYAWLVARFAVEIHALAGRRSDVFALLFYRALHVDTGVSPLVPVVLGALGFIAWCGWHRQRIILLRETSPFEAACLRYDALCSGPGALPGGTAPRVAHRAALAVADIRARLFFLVPEWRGAALAVVLISAGIWFWSTMGRTAESVVLTRAATAESPFETLLRFGVVILLAATAWGVYRLIMVWLRLRDCLDELSELPLVAAFERLPPRVSRLTRLSFFSPRSAHVIDGVTATQWSHLVEIHAKRADAFAAVGDGGGTAALTARLAALMALPAEAPAGPAGRWAQEVRRLELLALVLAELWREEPTAAEIDIVARELGELDARSLGSERPVTVSTSSRFRRTFSGAVRLWLRGAEEYAAVRVVEYVEWVLRHLRRLAGFLLLALLLGTAMLSSYPFTPQSRARLGLFAVLLAAVGAMLLVMSQMNRNEVLSRITKTDPGRITWDTPFVVNVLLFAVLPLLALLGSEFPEARTLLFGWLAPLLRTVGRT